MRVMLVDDDKNIRNTLSVSLKGLGCEVETASSVDEAMRGLRARRADFVLTDFKMEGRTGIDLLAEVKTLSPVPIVAVMTAYASFENAVTAIKEGAFDYIPKPFSTPQLAHLLKKVKTLISLQLENERLKKGVFRSDYFHGMTSRASTRLEEFVSRVAPTEATVLMTGESGTGKTELARLIHERSTRAQGPFVIVNCTSLAENLLESELFGHVRGAFTGAVQDRMGKVALADGGTLFLDEIGDLSLSGQTKLLRFLQEKIIERVGSNKPIAVNARVIAATNKDLSEAVGTGAFREDLYYRLNVFECHVAALRNRMEDFPVLLEKFLHEFGAASRLEQVPALSDGARKLLSGYRWPGNIRELRNVLERAVVLAHGRTIEVDDLPESVRANTFVTGPESEVLRSLEEVEREHISRVLALEPNQERAAKILGITTVTLWKRRKEFGLP